MTAKPQADPKRSGDGDFAADQPKAYASVAKAFALDRRVVHGGGKGFGSGTLKVDGKIFAMISSKGQFVVKLGATRVDDFIRNGFGERFGAGRDRQMKEWLALEGSIETWIEIAKEARLFVGGN